MAKDIVFNTSLIKSERDFFRVIFKLGLMPEDETSQRAQLKSIGEVEPVARQVLSEKLSMHEELRQGKPIIIRIS